jgi:hypothetical protein
VIALFVLVGRLLIARRLSCRSAVELVLEHGGLFRFLFRTAFFILGLLLQRRLRFQIVDLLFLIVRQHIGDLIVLFLPERLLLIKNLGMNILNLRLLIIAQIAQLIIWSRNSDMRRRLRFIARRHRRRILRYRRRPHPKRKCRHETHQTISKNHFTTPRK